MMLSLIALVIFHTAPPLGHRPPTADLNLQATALQAPFRHQLRGLADNPYYRIDAAVDLDMAAITGRLDLRYTNTTGHSLGELVFRLLPNAETIYGGGSLEVERVLQGERALAFELSGNGTVLHVPLTRRLAPSRTGSVQIEFVTRIPVDSHRGYGILNRTARITSLAGWYPILAVYQEGWQTPDIPRVGDGLVAETSLYEVALSVTTGARVVSTGRVTRVERKGAQAIWHMVSGPARDFAIAISPDFETHQAQVKGVTVRFHALPASSARMSASTAMSTITAAFEVFVDRFGPYPFTEFDVVEAPVPIGGYEFSGMVYVEDRLRVSGDPADHQYIVAHEVAHQWWYGLVGNDSIREPWLDEALATYAAAIYLEWAEGPAEADALVAYWQRTYGPRQGQDPPVNSPAQSFSNWPAYRTPVYYQGALFLAALREELGDPAFFLLLRRYLARFRYRTASTADLLQLAEAVACRDLDPLFERWFEVDGRPGARHCTDWPSGAPYRMAPR